jgi:hypothetical protein
MDLARLVVFRFAPALAVALLLTGALSAEEKVARTGSIMGTVTYKGKPLPAGIVAFHTAEGKALTALIQADGTFAAKAVPVGAVRVTVETESVRPKPRPERHPTEKPEERPKSVAIPAKYADPSTSGLTYEVKQGKQTFDIRLD